MIVTQVTKDHQLYPNLDLRLCTAEVHKVSYVRLQCIISSTIDSKLRWVWWNLPHNSDLHCLCEVQALSPKIWKGHQVCNTFIFFSKFNLWALRNQIRDAPGKLPLLAPKVQSLGNLLLPWSQVTSIPVSLTRKRKVKGNSSKMLGCSRGKS